MRRVVNSVIVLLGGPTVVVRGRRSGRLIRTPVPPFPFEGQRYLVSGYGQTQWARNLRAAGQGTLHRGRSREAFQATELVGLDRDRIIAAYRERLGRRVAGMFEALPDAADHPVFRLEVLPSGAERDSSVMG